MTLRQAVEVAIKTLKDTPRTMTPVGHESVHAQAAVRLARFLERLPELEAWIADEIKAIDSDERYHYPRATTDENAALALIQLTMRSRMQELQRFQHRIASILGEET